MNYDITRLILGIATLVVNYTTMFLTLDRRFGRLVSYSVPVLFTAAYYTVIYLSGLQNFAISSNGIVHLLVIIPLFKAQFFQKIFAFFLQMLATGTQIFLSSIIAGLFTEVGSNIFNPLQIAIVLAMYSIYIVFLHFYGRQIFKKMFIDGRRTEWAMYAFGAAFSFYVGTSYLTEFFISGKHLIILLFVLWSFAILCFAIINTHEKSRQKYETEFARDVISSGKEHYQKMNEMLDTLRIMRHDYKFHLDTINELINSDSKNEIELYLAGVRKQISEKELPNFCSNPVLNALLASYAERCDTLTINYNVTISMPEKIIPNYEMCIILGNLLENAVEACKWIKNDRKIELTINTQGSHLAVMVKNSFNGNVTENSGRPISTGKDDGLGLRSVQAVAARYDGELITECDKDTFTVYVMVKI